MAKRKIVNSRHAGRKTAYAHEAGKGKYTLTLADEKTVVGSVRKTTDGWVGSVKGKEVLTPKRKLPFQTKRAACKAVREKAKVRAPRGQN